MANREQDIKNQVNHANQVRNSVQGAIGISSPQARPTVQGAASNEPASLQQTRAPAQIGSADSAPPTVGRHARDLSTVELVKEITAEVGRLAQKQIELAKTELKADLKAEATTVGGLGVAALTGLATINLLLVTLVLALAQRMPGWVAGLVVSAFTLLVAGIVALIAWNKRVRNPLARTRRTIKEDVQFTKERLV